MRRGIESACLNCGKVVYYRASKVQIYCSMACRSAHRTVTLICETCQREFTVGRWTAGQGRRYCSRRCRPKSKRVVKGVRRPQAPEHVCERCGKTFRHSRDDAKYCSEKCFRPPVYVSCANCGKRFRTTPGTASGNRFCDLACWRRFNGETGPERAAREALQAAQIAFRQEVRIGRYSVDFLIGESLVVEIDGEYWHRAPARDARKDAYLSEHGFRVVRVPEEHAARVVAFLDGEAITYGESVCARPAQLAFALD